jgi:uncharacterized membrane protein YgdD (TMEM256/DUF423 family)
MSKTIAKSLAVALCALGALVVILGAFGAHGLEGHLSMDQKDTYDTAVLYHIVHVLAGLMVWGQIKGEGRWALLSLLFFLVGILLFSGSLYLLSTAHLHALPARWLGPITPIGGVFFILGWLALAYHHLKS